MGWGVSVTPRQHLTPGKDPVPIVQEAGWASGPVWTGAENLAPPGFNPRTVQPVGSRYTDYATRPTMTHLYSVNYWSTWHWKQISSSHNWIRGQEINCYVSYTMSANRRYHVRFNIRKMTSHNNLIPKYVFFFIYLLVKSFPCFIFNYSYRASRYFTDEYRVKGLR